MKIFKSYGFWTALSGALVMLINAIGKCFGFSVEEQIVSDIVMAIAGVLVVFGVVAMPKGEGKEEESLDDSFEEETYDPENENSKEVSEEQTSIEEQKETQEKNLEEETEDEHAQKE